MTKIQGEMVPHSTLLWWGPPGGEASERQGGGVGRAALLGESSQGHPGADLRGRGAESPLHLGDAQSETTWVTSWGLGTACPPVLPSS